MQSVLREGAELHPTLPRIVETPIVESSLHFLRSAAGDILWIITISVWIIGLIPIVLSLLAINRPEWRSGLSRRVLLTLISLLLTAYFFFVNRSDGAYAELEWNIFAIVHTVYWGFYTILLVLQKRAMGRVGLLILCFTLVFLFISALIESVHTSLLIIISILSVIASIFLMLEVRRGTNQGLVRVVILGIGVACIIVLIYINIRVEPQDTLLLKLISFTPTSPLIIVTWLFNLLISLSHLAQRIIVRQHQPRDPREEAYRVSKSMWAAICLACAGVIVAIQWYGKAVPPSPSLNVMFAFGAFASLYASAQSHHFWSRQRAYFRNVFTSVRHDSLRNIASPTLEEITLYNRANRWVKKFITFENPFIGVPLALLVGFFVIPLLQLGFIALTQDLQLAARAARPQQIAVTVIPTDVPSAASLTSTPEARNSLYAPPTTISIVTATPSVSDTGNTAVTDPIDDQLVNEPSNGGTKVQGTDTSNGGTDNFPTFAELMSIGFPSGLIFALAYLILWAIRHRQKYVVLPFTVECVDDERSLLGGVATQFAHTLTQEVREIGSLMQLRQVDNAHAAGGSALAHFVASGQEPQFIDELRSLTSFDNNAMGKLGGSILLLLANLLAIIKVRGTVRKHADNNIEIWIELSRQREQVVAVDKVIISLSRTDDIDEQTLRNVAHEMAIKLVLKLGQNYHLASSWESLKLFLDGLEAATKRNWWRAIDSYRNAIQFEEAQRGAFGIGHYHLGATLLALGEVDEAVKHLEQAEASGPPLAETYYTLALASVYRYWKTLDDDITRFKAIEHYCRRALRLRPNFPEAFHLLGSMYYRRAKLCERKYTKHYKDVKPAQSSNGSYNENEVRNPVARWIRELVGRADDASKQSYWWNDYKRARNHFRRAVRSYDQEIIRIYANDDVSQGNQLELSRVLQARSTAAHQLGDALRALSFHIEADTYYHDVLSIHPENPRTLIDTAKNYCLAGQWQRAEEFVNRRLFHVPEIAWTADAHFFAGWIIAGGVADALLERRYRPFTSFNLDETALRKLLGESVNHLEYAFTQRPRYLTRWSQSNWYTPFERSAHMLFRPALGGNTLSEKWLPRWLTHRGSNPSEWLSGEHAQNAHKERIKRNESKLFSAQAFLWLAWRMDAVDFGDNEDPMLKVIVASGFKTPTSIADLESIYAQFKLHKKQWALLLEDISASGRLYGTSHAWQKLRLAVSTLDNWKIAKAKFKDRLVELSKEQADERTNGPTFADRWFYATYTELTIFAARMLMEAWAFEAAIVVSKAGIDHTNDWFELYWKTNQKKDEPFRVSPYNFHYNLATLHAMKAFSTLRLGDQPETVARMGVYRKYKPVDFADYTALRERDVTTVQFDVQKALNLVPRHQLALYVQAQLSDEIASTTRQQVSCIVCFRLFHLTILSST
ncbi:MAG: hypothetical protein IPO91_31935 [Chloroflexi bacterium]|nr:hypothetical protein [Chloroflexota bacterium]